MDDKETRAFAQQLMKEVWEPFDSEAVSRFFHPDVVGWHRRADSSWQQLGYDDVVSRLAWDKETNANPVFDVREIIAEEDRFALRLLYVADFIPTGGKIDVEMMYFYQLRGDKVAEFGLLASVDFDSKAKGTEGTHKVTICREGCCPDGSVTKALHGCYLVLT